MTELQFQVPVPRVCTLPASSCDVCALQERTERLKHEAAELRRSKTEEWTEARREQAEGFTRSVGRTKEARKAQREKAKTMRDDWQKQKRRAAERGAELMHTLHAACCTLHHTLRAARDT